MITEIISQCKNVFSYPTEKEIDFLKEDICEHEFISKEFSSQTYGTCMNCGETLINLS